MESFPNFLCDIMPDFCHPFDLDRISHNLAMGCAASDTQKISGYEVPGTDEKLGPGEKNNQKVCHFGSCQE